MFNCFNISNITNDDKLRLEAEFDDTKAEYERLEEELTELIEKEFSLPYFEFIYDYHWDLGHGWDGDMK